jgi:TonB family protein
MRRYLKKRKTFFPLILSVILLLHIGTLSLKFRPYETAQKAKALIVKLQKSDPFKNKTQIVQSEDSESDKKMDDAFLSDKDRFFDRETKARKNDVFNSGSVKGSTSKSPPKDITLSDLGKGVTQDPFKEAALNYSKKKNGNPKADKSHEVSSTNDYLKDVPLGDFTNLNTAEYKYYGFYHRIRQRLEQFWGRSLHEKANQMIKDGRRVPASDELITALEITLDARGEITAIRIMGSSGIKELDDAAIESFNEAGPFPNPPKGLIVNGKVKIEWGFVVKS